MQVSTTQTLPIYSNFPVERTMFDFEPTQSCNKVLQSEGTMHIRNACNFLFRQRKKSAIYTCYLWKAHRPNILGRVIYFLSEYQSHCSHFRIRESPKPSRRQSKPMLPWWIPRLVVKSGENITKIRDSASAARLQELEKIGEFHWTNRQWDPALQNLAVDLVEYSLQNGEGRDRWP